jgi:hypothetical protein
VTLLSVILLSILGVLAAGFWGALMHNLGVNSPKRRVDMSYATPDLSLWFAGLGLLALSLLLHGGAIWWVMR